MESMLKAKPVKIFLWIMIPGVCLGILNMILIFLLPSGLMKIIYPILFIATGTAIYLWLGAIAKKLILKLPQEIQRAYEKNMFGFGLVLMIIGYGFIGYFIGEYFSSIFGSNFMNGRFPMNENMDDFFFAIIKFYLGIISGSLLTMTGNVMMVHLCARIIKSTKTGKIEHFKTSQLEFWLMLFAIVGIWILQPKITAFVNEQENEVDSFTDDDNVIV